MFTVADLCRTFPVPAPTRMSEDRIERIAEAFFNGLDRRFIEAREFGQAEYDAICAAFQAWEKACR